MKTLKNYSTVLLAVPFLLLGIAASAIASDAPRVPRTTLAVAEKSLDNRFAGLWSDNPFIMLGPTRGIYLEGYGAVFTAEVSLVMTPSITPFRSKITKEMADSIRQKKIQRLPFLKAAMKEMMHNMAATFVQVPEEQQMVLVVRFYYEPWEEMNGMPSQIVMRADRKGAMTGDVKVEEQ